MQSNETDDAKRRLQVIHTLRFALASIWTEIECGSPKIDDIQLIADEALNLSHPWATRSKDLDLDGVGLDSWQQYRRKYGY